MCIHEGSDMGGRIRGLGTNESWFSLVYRAIVLFRPWWRPIHVCDIFWVSVAYGVIVNLVPPHYSFSMAPPPYSPYILCFHSIKMSLTTLISPSISQYDSHHILKRDLNRPGWDDWDDNFKKQIKKFDFHLNRPGEIDFHVKQKIIIVSIAGRSRWKLKKQTKKFHSHLDRPGEIDFQVK
jgi:hypothetical protein